MNFSLRAASRFIIQKKWIKIFGGFGAALLGVTILAQFLFGKMKTPETTGKKK